MFDYCCPGCRNVLRLHKRAVVRDRFCNGCGTMITLREIRRQENAARRAEEEEAAREEALHAERLAAEERYLEIQHQQIALAREQDELRAKERRRRSAERMAALMPVVRLFTVWITVVVLVILIGWLSVSSIGPGWTAFFTALSSPLWLMILCVIFAAGADNKKQAALPLADEMASDDKTKIRCPQCGASLVVRMSARKIRCPACRTKFIFTAPTQPTASDVVEVPDPILRSKPARIVDKLMAAINGDLMNSSHRDSDVPPDRPHPDRQATMNIDSSDGPMTIYDDGTVEIVSISKNTRTIGYDPENDKRR